MSYSEELFPSSYQSWRHCITEKCRIPLTTDFAQQRISVLSNVHCEETQRFRTLYGDSHWQTILAWFRQADIEPGQR